LEVLVGGPLAAIVNAQAQAAKATTDFISEVGFERAGPGYPTRARKFEFEFERMAEYPYYPGEFYRQYVSMEVPFLTIAPIPFVRIGEASLDMEIKVVRPPQVEPKDTNVSISSKGESLLNKHIRIDGTYTYLKPIREPTDLGSTIKISLKLVQDPTPEGLARALTVLHDSIIATPK
jgi:Protein of unknown function (DUF2589)